MSNKQDRLSFASMIEVKSVDVAANEHFCFFSLHWSALSQDDGVRGEMKLALCKMK